MRTAVAALVISAVFATIASLLAVVYKADPLSWVFILIGSFIPGLLFGIGYGFKGLLGSLLVGLVYLLVLFAFIAYTPSSGGGSFLAGLAFIAAFILAGVTFFLALIGGVIGAVVRRLRR
ncbi:MAG: hypothetical protein QXQ48_09560 [Nitrososphaerota archaeon]